MGGSLRTLFQWNRICTAKIVARDEEHITLQNTGILNTEAKSEKEDSKKEKPAILEQNRPQGPIKTDL